MTTTTTSEKTGFKPADVVIDPIVAKMEEGVIPWVKPWACLGVPVQNMKSLRPYTGINALVLNMMGFAQPYFLSYKQVGEMGGQVIPDQAKKSIPILFWKSSIREVEEGTRGAYFDKKDRTWKKQSLIERYYRVYNVEQTTGLEDKIPKNDKEITPPTPDAAATAAIEAVNAYCVRENIEVRHGGDRALYSILTDHIGMPKLEQFISVATYASTLAHEAGHSTGASTRLNRAEIAGMSGSTFGSDAYGREELTAELTASMVLNALGCPIQIDNSAAYLQHWLGAIKGDRKMLVIAAQRANHASALILKTEDETAVTE